LAVAWRPATILSGLGESAIALISLIYWYSYSVTHWAGDAVDVAIRAGARINPNAVGFAGLALWAMHPLTWWIAYCGIEGMVRLVGAAFTENHLGILPLFVLDKLTMKLSGRGEQGVAEADGYSETRFSSYIGALREGVVKGIADVPDELCFTGSAPDEMLEIRACRRKADWDAPRTVRYQDNYYRLEVCSEGSALRPFRYTLRKLSAGVMGRTVLVYSPEETPILAKN
jgi:hypothetical protein